MTIKALYLRSSHWLEVYTHYPLHFHLLLHAARSAAIAFCHTLYIIWSKRITIQFKCRALAIERLRKPSQRKRFEGKTKELSALKKNEEDKKAKKGGVWQRKTKVVYICSVPHFSNCAKELNENVLHLNANFFFPIHQSHFRSPFFPCFLSVLLLLNYISRVLIPKRKWLPS